MFHFTQKTVSVLACLTVLGAVVAPASSLAQNQDDEPKFSASVDRRQIAEDESIALKLTVESDGSERISDPSFEAPDFREVSEYPSNSVQQYMVNGRIWSEVTQSITKIMTPAKQGSLKISKIRVQIGSKVYTAPDIVVQVGAPGAGTPPPPGYGGNSVGLRGAKPGSLRQVMVRAEVSKPRLYKGEQLIVSYYLYSRVRLSNLSPDKIPVLNGFLREDLEVPILNQQRLDTEMEVVNGVQYRKSLLARYAAYPLQEGKLKIDSMGLKFTYFPNNRDTVYDEEDPFLNFFQSLTPRSGQEKSEQITVEVLPVPEAGKPASFTGGVGDFNVSASVNRNEVRANEALTLSFKIDGRGNLAAIGEPKAKWPPNVELYEAKGHVNAGRGGVGNKTFDFLLIPRVPGKITLPSMEISFFDPVQGQYVTRTTNPIDVNVLEGAPGSGSTGTPAANNVARSRGDTKADREGESAGGGAVEKLRGLRQSGTAPEVDIQGHPAWRWLYWLFVGFIGIFVLLVAADWVRALLGHRQERNSERAKAEAKSFRALQARAKSCADGAPWDEVVSTYETLSLVLMDLIDEKHAVGARSLPRGRLGEILVGEKGMESGAWDRLRGILEYAETVRFASAAVSEQEARAKLPGFVADAETVAREI